MKLSDAAKTLVEVASRRKVIGRQEAEAVSDGWLEPIPRGQYMYFMEEDAVAVESCAAALLRKESRSQAWDQDELIRLLFLFLTGALEAPSPTTEEEARDGLERLFETTEVLVAMPLANVAWEGDPFASDDFVIGMASAEWVDAVTHVARARSGLPPAITKCWWLDPIGSHWQRRIIPAFATWIHGRRGRRAIGAAIERFDELVSMCLMADEDPEARELFSGRGPSHRPGVRGLAIDRPNLLRLLDGVNTEAVGVASAEIVVGDEFGGGLHTHWYGEDPFPLEALLGGSRQRQMLVHLTDRSHIAHRFRTAARWYGKAHWAESSEDHMLALGIAADALLGEQAGVPGREIVDRFALLASGESRGERADRMKTIHRARSAVAHGGSPKEVEDIRFLRGVEADIRWCAWTLHRTAAARGVTTPHEIKRLFENLKWGIVQPESTDAVGKSGSSRNPVRMIAPDQASSSSGESGGQ